VAIKSAITRASQKSCDLVLEKYVFFFERTFRSFRRIIHLLCIKKSRCAQFCIILPILLHAVLYVLVYVATLKFLPSCKLTYAAGNRIYKNTSNFLITWGKVYVLFRPTFQEIILYRFSVVKGFKFVATGVIIQNDISALNFLLHT
jgi:hypothetical protein